ncbi:MAG: peptide ABC transporter substrate-binding protein [Lachnospiraceae bacterium]|nr:peptide ABC transporter substrate-binding protein [Lachnospiraceae bacterium]
MKKRTIWTLAGLILGAGLLMSCGGYDNSAATLGSAEASSASDAGDASNVNIALEAQVTTLDHTVTDVPADLSVARTMQDTLLEQTETDIREGLAESYEMSPDGLTYTFHLRDAKFSNGDPITAEDFVYSWKRLVNPDTGAAYAWYAGAAGIENADAIAFEGADLDTLGVEAVDEKTLVVRLDHPVPYFTAIITIPCFSPISAAFGQEHPLYGQSAEDILSSGPYVVDEWVPGSAELRLRKNEQYWNKDAIQMETLTFKAVTDEQSGILSYEAGDLDMVTLTGDMAAKYADNEALDLELSPKMEYLYLNHENPYLKDKNMRLALAYALNKDDITKSILKDGSRSADYFVPEKFAYDENGVAYHDAVTLQGLSYDEEKALKAFEDAKAALGTEKVSLELLYDDTAKSKTVSQYLKSALEKTLPGLTIDLREVPYAACWDEQKAGNFDMTISSWMADYIDPSSYFDMLVSTNEYNLGNWVNAEYDGYCADAAGKLATDPKARVDSYGRAEQVILDDVGLIPVYQTSSASLIRPGIKIRFAPYGSYLYRYITR